MKKLGGLVSVKGEDLLLQAPTENLVRFHRLRASIPGRLWKWRTVCGWQWQSHSDHINVLEMRAAFTSVKWRVLKGKMSSKKFLHLTDSLVCLHALSRGRSSSRKLRRTLVKLNSYLLVANLHPVWGYIHTSQNPADRPRAAWQSKIPYRSARDKKPVRKGPSRFLQILEKGGLGTPFLAGQA